MTPMIGDGAALSSCASQLSRFEEFQATPRYGAVHPEGRSLATIRRALGYFAGAKFGALAKASLSCFDAQSWKPMRCLLPYKGLEVG